MTPEQQRIAIAEACGWIDFSSAAHEGAIQYGRRPFSCSDSWELPDYLNDLNAMHEAEKMLEADDNHAYGCYCSDLYEKYGNTVSLTASQRAEAFLRTINKWTTNPNEL